MLRRGRECVFWPGMSAEIKVLASTCDACQSFARAQQKESSLMPIEAKSPWEIVGVDLFTLDNKDYLLTIDYFSGFWEVDKLNSATTATVVKRLKLHFSRYGVPCTLISENGPQFASQEFHDFAVKWDFEHCPSAPTHSNANGKVESGVKAAKSMLKKCKKNNTDPNLALLEIRNTLLKVWVLALHNACSTAALCRYYQLLRNNLLPGEVSFQKQIRPHAAQSCAGLFLIV